MKHVLMALFLAFSLPHLASAQPAVSVPKEAPLMAEDPVIEKRLIGIADELRCLVCQNESLADSDAELAEDLRREVRDLIRAGLDDSQVIEHLIDRYGYFVLYRPPFKPMTYLLWFGPVLLLGLGAGIWFMTMRRRRTQQNEPVDTQRLAAAAKLLDESK